MPLKQFVFPVLPLCILNHLSRPLVFRLVSALYPRFVMRGHFTCLRMLLMTGRWHTCAGLKPSAWQMKAVITLASAL